MFVISGGNWTPKIWSSEMYNDLIKKISINLIILNLYLLDHNQKKISIIEK